MGITRDEPDHLIKLRRRAEEALRGKTIELNDLTPEDFQYLLHELQVHQEELNLQNVELRRVQLELETSRNKYSDLYHFAPAGYCTIDRKGRILEANQTLADLLGVDKQKLIKERLAHYVAPDDQDKFFLHIQQAFGNHEHRVSEIRLINQAGDTIFIRLESKVAHGDENRLLVMLVDISEQRSLQRRLSELREEELLQVARDLHDGPTQELGALNFALQGILLDYPVDGLSQSLEAIQAKLREQIQVIRDYAMQLRPPILAHFGLEKAVRSLTDSFTETHPGVGMKVEVHLDQPSLSEAVDRALFHICQEALRNISKHALPGASEVHVHLNQDDHKVHLEIQDNGQGFDLPKDWLNYAREGHVGLLGMEERADAAGGQLVLQSRRGSGTLVWVTIPLNQHPAG